MAEVPFRPTHWDLKDQNQDRSEAVFLHEHLKKKKKS